jgi:hypothetical protein
LIAARQVRFAAKIKENIKRWSVYEDWRKPFVLKD